MRLLKIVCFMLVCFMPFSVMAETSRPKIPMELYGQIFNVEPVRIKNAQMSYNQLRAYIPVVLTQLKTENRTHPEVIAHLEQVSNAYAQIYTSSVFMLARRIKHFVPQSNIRDLYMELGDAFRAGKWKAITKKYSHYSRSVPPQILEVQKTHNKYLAVLYLSEMVNHSVEAKAHYKEMESRMQEEGGHEHDHDHLSDVEFKKYEYGFDYERISFPDPTLHPDYEDHEGHDHDEHGHEGHDDHGH